MWPPGHLAIGYLLARTAGRRGSDEPASDLVVQGCVLASILPDLVDKLFAWGLGVLPGGRTLTHSLLVLGPATAFFVLLARRLGRLDLGLLFGLAALSHPLIDALPAVWDPERTASHLLWPILAVDTVERSPPGTGTVQELLLTRLTTPWFLVELGLVALAIGLWYRGRDPGHFRTGGEHRSR
jgi:membrane-bound metal-dependent hydrolase YbcI (DUF457 family)